MIPTARYYSDIVLVDEAPGISLEPPDNPEYLNYLLKYAQIPTVVRASLLRDWFGVIEEVNKHERVYNDPKSDSAHIYWNQQKCPQGVLCVVDPGMLEDDFEFHSPDLARQIEVGINSSYRIELARFLKSFFLAPRAGAYISGISTWHNLVVPSPIVEAVNQLENGKIRSTQQLWPFLERAVSGDGIEVAEATRIQFLNAVQTEIAKAERQNTVPAGKATTEEITIEDRVRDRVASLERRKPDETDGKYRLRQARSLVRAIQEFPKIIDDTTLKRIVEVFIKWGDGVTDADIPDYEIKDENETLKIQDQKLVKRIEFLETSMPHRSDEAYRLRFLRHLIERIQETDEYISSALIIRMIEAIKTWYPVAEGEQTTSLSSSVHS